MEQNNMIEIKRKIGYLEHILNKLERNMLKQQSDRFNIKQRLLYLNLLQKNTHMKNQVRLTNYN